jgi:class 3 adenylate cyclase
VGVRAVKDMAWIGSAANYAAKLNSFDGIDHDYPIRITENTYQKLSSKMLLSAGDFPIWDGPYNNLKNRLHYRSSCHISLD